MPPTATAALIVVLIGAIAWQLVALLCKGRRRPVGDEAGYIARRDIFIRPPMMRWLSLLAGGGGTESTERRLRWLMSALTIATIALTAYAGWWLGGPWGAVIAAALLTLQPERVILGCHVWPDTPLALVLAAIAAVWVTPLDALTATWALGGLAALGVLVRIDVVVVPVALVLAWAQTHDAWTLPAMTGLLAPSVAVVVILTGWNTIRHGVPLPDTTWAFNFMVMQTEAAETDGKDPFELEPVVQSAATAWRALSPAGGARRGLAALGATVRRPGRLLRGVVRRLLALAGPDTFVREKLLAEGGAYPELGDAARRRWRAGLAAGFPLLLTLAVASLVARTQGPDAVTWPALAILAVAVVFHARTRYRVAVLPALALIVASTLGDGVDPAFTRPLAAGLLLAGSLTLFALLLRIRSATELRPTAAGEGRTCNSE